MQVSGPWELKLRGPGELVGLGASAHASSNWEPE